MLRSVKHFLAPPVFADEEKTRAARTLNAVLALVFIVVGLHLIANILFSNDVSSVILAAVMTLARKVSESNSARRRRR